MNQVEFLGLAHTFATVSDHLATFKLFQLNLLHKSTDTRVEIKICAVVRVVLRNNYQSRNLIGPYHFLEISPRNSTLFTRLFLAMRCAWAGHETSRSLATSIADSGKPQLIDCV